MNKRMSKIKKVLMSLATFCVASVTKFGGLISRARENIQPNYTTIVDQTAYGPPEALKGYRFFKIFKPVSLVVVLIIGLGVLLSKKISRKFKAIIIFLLALVSILGYLLIDYIKYNL